MPRVAKKLPVPSEEMVTWALQGLEREIEETRKRLDTLLAHRAALRARTGGKPGAAPAPTPAAGVAPAAGAVPVKRKVMSPEARRRISLAMKRRWAERKRQAQAAAKK